MNLYTPLYEEVENDDGSSSFVPYTGPEIGPPDGRKGWQSDFDLTPDINRVRRELAIADIENQPEKIPYLQRTLNELRNSQHELDSMRRWSSAARNIMFAADRFVGTATFGIGDLEPIRKLRYGGTAPEEEGIVPETMGENISAALGATAGILATAKVGPAKGESYLGNIQKFMKAPTNALGKSVFSWTAGHAGRVQVVSRLGFGAAHQVPKTLEGLFSGDRDVANQAAYNFMRGMVSTAAAMFPENVIPPGIINFIGQVSTDVAVDFGFDYVNDPNILGGKHFWNDFGRWFLQYEIPNMMTSVIFAARDLKNQDMLLEQQADIKGMFKRKVADAASAYKSAAIASGQTLSGRSVDDPQTRAARELAEQDGTWTLRIGPYGADGDAAEPHLQTAMGVRGEKVLKLRRAARLSAEKFGSSVDEIKFVTPDGSEVAKLETGNILPEGHSAIITRIDGTVINLRATDGPLDLGHIFEGGGEGRTNSRNMGRMWKHWGNDGARWEDDEGRIHYVDPEDIIRSNQREGRRAGQDRLVKEGKLAPGKILAEDEFQWQMYPKTAKEGDKVEDSYEALKESKTLTTTGKWRNQTHKGILKRLHTSFMHLVGKERIDLDKIEDVRWGKYDMGVMERNLLQLNEIFRATNHEELVRMIRETQGSQASRRYVAKLKKIKTHTNQQEAFRQLLIAMAGGETTGIKKGLRGGAKRPNAETMARRARLIYSELSDAVVDYKLSPYRGVRFKTASERVETAEELAEIESRSAKRIKRLQSITPEQRAARGPIAQQVKHNTVSKASPYAVYGSQGHDRVRRVLAPDDTVLYDRATSTDRHRQYVQEFWSEMIDAFGGKISDDVLIEELGVSSTRSTRKVKNAQGQTTIEQRPSELDRVKDNLRKYVGAEEMEKHWVEDLDYYDRLEHYHRVVSDTLKRAGFTDEEAEYVGLRLMRRRRGMFGGKKDNKFAMLEEKYKMKAIADALTVFTKTPGDAEGFVARLSSDLDQRRYQLDAVAEMARIRAEELKANLDATGQIEDGVPRSRPRELFAPSKAQKYFRSMRYNFYRVAIQTGTDIGHLYDRIVTEGAIGEGEAAAKVQKLFAHLNNKDAYRFANYNNGEIQNLVKSYLMAADNNVRKQQVREQLLQHGEKYLQVATNIEKFLNDEFVPYVSTARAIQWFIRERDSNKLVQDTNKKYRTLIMEAKYKGDLAEVDRLTQEHDDKLRGIFEKGENPYNPNYTIDAEPGSLHDRTRGTVRGSYEFYKFIKETLAKPNGNKILFDWFSERIDLEGPEGATVKGRRSFGTMKNYFMGAYRFDPAESLVGHVAGLMRVGGGLVEKQREYQEFNDAANWGKSRMDTERTAIIHDTRLVTDALHRHVVSVMTTMRTAPDLSKMFQTINKYSPTEEDVAFLERWSNNVYGRSHGHDPAATVFEKLRKVFWLTYFGKGYTVPKYMLRNFGQNLALLPGAVSSKAAFKAAQLAMQEGNIPADLKREFESDTFQNHVLQTDALRKHHTFIDLAYSDNPKAQYITKMFNATLGKAVTTSDSVNRHVTYGLSYLAAKDAMARHRAGKLDYTKMVNELGIGSFDVYERVRLEQLWQLDDGGAAFRTYYASIMTRNVNFLYRWEERSYLEQSRMGRAIAGIATWPRGVSELAFSRIVKPFTNPDATHGEKYRATASMVGMMIAPAVTNMILNTIMGTNKEYYGPQSFIADFIDPGLSQAKEVWGLTRGITGYIGTYLPGSINETDRQQYKQEIQRSADRVVYALPVIDFFLNAAEAVGDKQSISLFKTIKSDLLGDEYVTKEVERTAIEKIQKIVFGGNYDVSSREFYDAYKKGNFETKAVRLYPTRSDRPRQLSLERSFRSIQGKRREAGLDASGVEVEDNRTFVPEADAEIELATEVIKEKAKRKKRRRRRGL